MRRDPLGPTHLVFDSGVNDPLKNLPGTTNTVLLILPEPAQLCPGEGFFYSPRVTKVKGFRLLDRYAEKNYRLVGPTLG